MSKLASTTEIIRNARRLDGPAAFFALFPTAWDAVTREVWKLETRQTYQEPGNPSWELLVQGDWNAAMRVLPQVRAGDETLYQSLSRKGVKFVRCRPIELPLTTYLRWEIACYDLNAIYGESIYFVDWKTTARVFIEHARHDFVIFDERLALIHDYDAAGRIQGGWEVTRPQDVLKLRRLFSFLLAQASPYREFLAAHVL